MNEAQKIAGGGGSEQDIAEATIELEVIHVCAMPCESLVDVLQQVLESLQASMK